MIAPDRRCPAALLAALLLAGCAAPAPLRDGYVDFSALAATALPPPPAPGSAAERADVAALLEAKAKRTDADCARANATFFLGWDHLWGDRSPFPSPLPDGVRGFFDRIDSEIGTIARALKDRFRRPRPELLPPCPPPPGRKGGGGGYSYPSTHAALSRAFALVLADLVPARRDELLARADAIAADRVLIGVHYPSDVAAGKALADRYHDALSRSAAYRADLEAARSRLVE